MVLIDDKRRSFVYDPDYDINQEKNGIQVMPFYVNVSQDNILPKVAFEIIKRIMLDNKDITNKSNSRTIIK